MRRSTVIYAVLLHVTVMCGCFSERTREAPSGSTIAKLEGRCLILMQPVLLVRGEEEQIADSYLAPASNASIAGETLAAGDHLVIERVVLKRTFDGRYAIIVGRCARYPHRRISLFFLFDTTWTRQAEEAAFENRIDVPRLSGALAHDRVTWCQ